MDADLTRRQILRGTAAGVGFAVTAGIAGAPAAGATPLVGSTTSSWSAPARPG